MDVLYVVIHVCCFILQCLLVGDSEGQVTVLQLRSMPAPPSLDQQVVPSDRTII